MNTIIILCFIALLSVCTALNCYSCSSIGCSDPFNPSAVGVSTTGAISSNTYCRKIANSGTIVRDGSSSCTSVAFISNTGIGCCQTDLCNATNSNYKGSFLWIASVAVIMAKIVFS